MKNLEGVPLHFLIDELKVAIQGSRIQKVSVADQYTIFLQLFTQAGLGELGISIHPEMNLLFWHIGKTPSLPSTKRGAFEQLLNKYLTGGRITNIQQVGWDRVVQVTVHNPSLWQEKDTFTFWIELTGRNANCILTDDGPSFNVLGSSRAITARHSRYRTILPGHPYLLPPPQESKLDPIKFITKPPPLKELSFDRQNFKKWIINHLAGFGPFLAQWIVDYFESNPPLPGPPEKQLKKALQFLFKPLIEGNYQVFLFFQPQDFKPVGIFWLKNSSPYQDMPHKTYSTFSEALFNFYLFHRTWKEKYDLEEKRKRKLQQELDFWEKEEEKILLSLAEEQNLLELKTKGELLKLYPALTIKKRDAHGIWVVNHFSQKEETVFIELDPNLSISQNMQQYFRKYRKAINRNQQLKKRLAFIAEKKDSLNSALRQPAVAPYLSTPPTKGKKKSASKLPAGIIKFTTPSGNEILVGKNQKSNHLLLTRMANRSDFWFHIRDLTGSHTILKVNHPATQIEDMVRAAQVAAYFSKARGETKTEVIVTQVKHLRFPPGANLGKVIFQNEKTYLVPAVLPRELS
ncbi:MAG: hypothetical protein PWP04_342 [Candidatus Atribacteria bacterium]|nr:hypothetical protein [Candidatus Atribacteria bacterium]